MIFRKSFLDGIRDGSVTLAFRRWRRPTVRTGGTLLTAVGELHIQSVVPVDLESITDADARRAGFESRDALLAELNVPGEGEVYRIELGPLRPDPRIALRDAPPDAAELEELKKRLRRLDSAASAPWTFRVLEVVSANPEIRAGDLCGLLGQEKEDFKRNVRKLKTLGLTESLDVGYRLSPRGAALLETLRRVDGPTGST